MTTLTMFDDHDVTECAVRITRAGDGLSESLDVAPVELHHDQTIYVVLRCTVTKISHEQIKDSDELRRVHTLSTTFGTIIDETVARKILDAARRSIETARGIQRIPGTDDDG